MRTLLASAATAILAACTSLPAALAVPEQADLVIRNVTVIDPESRNTRVSSDVFVDDGRIVEIADSGVSVRPAEQAVDGDGKFLIPGLMDMHTHSSFRPVHDASLKLMLANGVTGVREMGSDCVEPGGITMCLDEMRAVGEAIERGEVLGPRMLALSTAKVDSNRQQDAGEAAVMYRPVTADDAQRTVAYLADRRPDILKVGDQFMPDAFLAFAAAARERGMRFGGHIPPYLSVGDVAAQGMTSIEHARDLPLDCSTYGAQFRGAVMDALTGKAEGWPDRSKMPAQARDTFDQATCDAQIAAMVDNGTYYVPTHLTREMDFRAGQAGYRNDPRLAYISGFQQEHWNGDLNRTAQRLGPIAGDLEDFFRLGLKTTGMAHAAGVKIMAGTDANDTMVFPGFSLHDELRHLVAAGLTPMDALRAATSVPAEYLGRTDDFGGLAVGKVADLLLLDASPLADISNTTRIAGVIFGGLYHDRAALDALLADVRAWKAEADRQMTAEQG